VRSPLLVEWAVNFVVIEELHRQLVIVTAAWTHSGRKCIKGSYTESKDNLRYGLKAVALLRTNPTLADHKETSWATLGEGKQPNSQWTLLYRFASAAW